ncbi:DUF2867 domain-containing protein [Streptomyces sp. ISL-66]|uniref:DUF2867 domain-containing protein n=1 Tax=Streptomyces sp. ISL-66 TaxID=2819186 RepID=UPI001BE801FB|nr:DUF2867 domain-containing protein [Streptomyces sp. ISL-66]MBT2471618.1 DUF2867 domain-containing protein [Streptomyces sp. ISL-66]
MDAVAVDVAPGTSAVEFTRVIFTGSPLWMGRLMALRDKLVAPFGLQVKERGKAAATRIEPGVKRGPFRILSVTEDEVLCGDDDKHLDFRVSFAVRPKTDGPGSEGVCTTVVRFNRPIGRLYFRTIEPFHHLIVATLLRPRHPPAPAP